MKLTLEKPPKDLIVNEQSTPVERKRKLIAQLSPQPNHQIFKLIDGRVVTLTFDDFITSYVRIVFIATDGTYGLKKKVELRLDERADTYVTALNKSNAAKQLRKQGYFVHSS